jgi:hypothetical protein
MATKRKEGIKEKGKLVTKAGKDEKTFATTQKTIEKVGGAKKK